MNYNFIKKLTFFWVIFHLLAFISFKLQWTPSFDEKESTLIKKNYVLTPEYGYNGKLLGSEMCYNCNYKESENFYPFHKFTYGWGTSYQQEKGFIGIFGYYGNDEFIVYIIIPLILYLIFLLYKKIIVKSNSKK